MAYFLQKEGGKVGPIVLQETITKVAHRCLDRRLLVILKGKIPQHQFCMNIPNGTTTVTLGLQKEMKEGRTKYIAAVDFTNAFNTLSHYTLVENMERTGIDPSYTSYVATYLERFTVKHRKRIIKNEGGVYRKVAHSR